MPRKFHIERDMTHAAAKFILHAMATSAGVLADASIAHAANHAGMVTCLEGEASATLAGIGGPAGVGTELRMGDRIESGPAGALKIEMTDATVVTLGENSKLQIGDYDATANPSALGILRLEKGTFFVEVGSIAAAQGGTFKIRAPSHGWIAALRTGNTPTHFSGFLTTQQLTVRLWQGAGVVVGNEAGETTLAQPNTETNVAGANVAPAAALPVTAAQTHGVPQCDS